MFDDGDLLVLTFGNCVLKAGPVIKCPVKLYVRFFTFFNVFFKIQKKHNFLRFFELLHTFSRTLGQAANLPGCDADRINFAARQVY